jgi:hypothetical protein
MNTQINRERERKKEEKHNLTEEKLKQCKNKDRRKSKTLSDWRETQTDNLNNKRPIRQRIKIKGEKNGTN